jgi:hypothetical protein
MDIILKDYSYIIIFLAGFVGAVIADIMKDNCIELPKKLDGKFYLGSIGGFIIGGFAGLAIDGSLLTAFMGGYMGKGVIMSLVDKRSGRRLSDDVEIS